MQHSVAHLLDTVGHEQERVDQRRHRIREAIHRGMEELDGCTCLGHVRLLLQDGAKSDQILERHRVSVQREAVSPTACVITSLLR